MFFGILLFLFLIICILTCLLILVQSDKGGGISGAIGGLSGANSFLGSQGTADALTKGTYIFGGVFLLLCVLMTLFEPGGGAAKSGLQKRAEAVQAVTPVPASAFSVDAMADDGGAGAAVRSGGEALDGGADPAAVFGGAIEGGEANAPE
ncbi:MAG: preprotein translocase subunit SecG [Chitinispirillales bacterium]|jgi:preprotein translocase subunit SecG|nr:preprotein translocase subunit SecG [Chitinispirillales bacterium]